MLDYRGDHTSLIGTVMSVIILVSCFFLSFLINPPVYYSSKHKVSTTEFLFALLAPADFLRGVLIPVYVLLVQCVGVHYNFNEMVCLDNVTSSVWSCYSPSVSVLQLSFTFLSLSLNLYTLIITSVIVISCSFSLFFPLYRVGKSRVLLVTVILLCGQFLLIVRNFSATEELLVFLPSICSAWNLNPYHLRSSKYRILQTQTISTCISLGLQFISVFASGNVSLSRLPVLNKSAREQQINSKHLVDGVKARREGAIFKNRTADIPAKTLRTFPISYLKRSNRSSCSRISSVLKAARANRYTKTLLINTCSLIYTCASLISLSFMGSTGTVSTQLQGWTNFIVVVVLPVLAAVCNPVIYITLTPGAAEKVKDYLYREVVKSVGESSGVRWERCRSRRRRHQTRVLDKLEQTTVLDKQDGDNVKRNRVLDKQDCVKRSIELKFDEAADCTERKKCDQAADCSERKKCDEAADCSERKKCDQAADCSERKKCDEAADCTERKKCDQAAINNEGEFQQVVHPAIGRFKWL